MNADHLSYSRAVSVSILGLVLQSVMGIATLIYGILGEDPAALSGSFAILLGIPVWVALALVFHQHRLERLESLEAQAYAASAAAKAAVFETSSDELVQKNRLDWMHKWFLPTLSLALSAGYIALGIVRYLQNRDGATLDGFTAPPNSGFAEGLGAGMLFLGFLLARYVSGMAKQRVWTLLRAGAAASAGCAVVGLALLVGHVAYKPFGNETPLRLLPLVIDIYMIVLGVEIAANFLLTLYLPRKPGEYVRPAFDSRILAFIAAPDRIAKSISEAFNYQFGFDVSSTWFYRLVSRSFLGLVLLGALIVWGATTIAIVRPEEKGLLLVNGRYVREVPPGPVVKAPWPFAKVIRFPATGVNELHVGAAPPQPGAPVLWTEAHAGGGAEYAMVVQPTRSAIGAARDYELLVSEFPIRYRVSDLYKFKWLTLDGPAADPDRYRRELLQHEAASTITEYIGRFSADQLLGAARSGIAADLAAQVQARFDALGPDGEGAGVELLFVGMNGVHPPLEAAPSFESVIRADQEREAAIERAQADRIRTLSDVAGSVEKAEAIVAALDRLSRERERDPASPELEKLSQEVSDLLASAGGRAANLIVEARANRWSAHFNARAHAIRTEGLAKIYNAAPRVFSMERVVETLVEVTTGKQVVVIGIEGASLRIELSEPFIDVSGWTPAQPEQE